MSLYTKILSSSSRLTKATLLRTNYIFWSQRMAASSVSVIKGDLNALSPNVRQFIEEKAKLCTPDNVFICDGSAEENKSLIDGLTKDGIVKPLTKYENNVLALTDPGDVARVESKTVICTETQRETTPIPKEGVKGVLGQWISPKEFTAKLDDRFPGCMKGRTMYVIPFSMGPVGSPLAKIGIQLTDSPYVVACMRIMTRMGSKVLDVLQDGEFVSCLHSVGVPLPAKDTGYNWPCNPEKTIIGHIPNQRKIMSFGSGYGGNSLLGKKCFALRIASCIARDEGWLAEHMLILGITSPEGKKKYIAAAFPSACGKTNLAMMTPTIPGWKVECVGDDIAWMKFDEEGNLRAINPENGFFGVAPGTSMKTNPNAMKTIQKNTIFTNVAEASDGGFYWDGLEDEVDMSQNFTDWKGKPWKQGDKVAAAHPNSRFCTPSAQCPIMDPKWEDPKGVPISAILFGGRRPQGVPLVYEAFNWQHGVFIGAAMRSEATAAAEHKAKVIMHDPFAMRPFFGYNFGNYLKHWLSMENRENAKLPKIFHVNWFRKSTDGKFLWPGFGENSRVLEWIFKRTDNADIADKSPIGYVPKADSLNVDGLEPVDMKQLLNIPKDFWSNEVKEIGKYFEEQVGDDLPNEVANQLKELGNRVNEMKN